MKNQYAVLERDYQDTISRLCVTTGWSTDQAKSVVELVVLAAEKKANAVAVKNVRDMKNTKYLATKKLLQNYRRLRAAISQGTEHALKLLEDTEYQRLMQAEDSLQNQKVQSVALIAAANRVLWAQVNTALECFKEICEGSSAVSTKRGYDLLYWRYLAPGKIPVDSISEKHHIERAQFFRDIKEAVETLSVLLFGLGNTENFISSHRKGEVIEQ